MVPWPESNRLLAELDFESAVYPVSPQGPSVAGRRAGAAKRAAPFIKLNHLVVKDNYIQPILSRTRVAALANKLTVAYLGLGQHLWQLASWYREA